MADNGLPPCRVHLQDRPCNLTAGRAIHHLVASEDLQPGDIAFRVPNNLVVTLERVLGDESIAELLTTNKLSELACLALYLMYEKKQGKESFWYPFIRELDRQRGRGQLAVESPLLWTNEERETYLQGSPMRQVVQDRLAGIKREYEELDTVWFMAGSLFKVRLYTAIGAPAYGLDGAKLDSKLHGYSSQYPYDIPTEAFPFEIFKQAFVAIQACVVHLQGVSLARRFALVPLGPPLLSYESNCRCMLKGVDGFVQLEVDRAYKAGEPIVVWCGPQPNSRLLLNYGFVDEKNPYDRLAVEAALDPKDPLYQNKRAIVQKNDRLTIQTFQASAALTCALSCLGGSFATAVLPFLTPQIISLLNIYKGREKEAVMDMLPYLRLGHVSDPEDMDSVGFAEGPICPVSPCNERAVLGQLAGYFKSRLDAYKSTLEEDVAVIADDQTCPKKKVATQLLRIEKRILNSALSTVQELIDALPIREAPCSGQYMPTLK
eukprot:SM000032S12030  [mRNA]  locus=s32:3530:6968:- [translate_table: standard]